MMKKLIVFSIIATATKPTNFHAVVSAYVHHSSVLQPSFRPGHSTIGSLSDSSTVPSFLSYASTTSSSLALRQGKKRLVQTSVVSRNENVKLTELFASSSSSNTMPQDEEPELDVDALSKYLVAGIVQMGCFYLLLNGFDLTIDKLGIEHTSIPIWANAIFFWGCSIKSRIFNPLSNERPNVKEVVPGGKEINRPSWTPPGIFFPIMWVIVIGSIRAYSSALIIDTTEQYANIATLSFLFHLTIGDIWNTINNVEKRLGAAASGVLLVIGSAANASYQYYQVDPFAGKLLSASLLWLCTAGVLVNSIRQLNPVNEQQTKLDPLFPVKGSTIKTEFAWFAASGSE